MKAGGILLDTYDKDARGSDGVMSERALRNFVIRARTGERWSHLLAG